MCIRHVIEHQDWLSNKYNKLLNIKNRLLMNVTRYVGEPETYRISNLVVSRGFYYF